MEKNGAGDPAAGMAPDTSDFGWALGIVLRQWQRETEDALQGLPNGPRGYQILSTVVRHDPPTQVALATHLGIDRSIMTYLIDSLVDAGLVERRQDPADRRNRRIVATAEGAAKLREFQQQVTEVEDTILGGLAPEERRVLVTLMERVATATHLASPGTDSCEAVSTLLAGTP
jgi:MarR family transcriptional regulator for hemolysin